MAQNAQVLLDVCVYRPTTAEHICRWGHRLKSHLQPVEAGTEPVNTGLQGKWFIHYPMAAPAPVWFETKQRFLVKKHGRPLEYGYITIFKMFCSRRYWVYKEIRSEKRPHKTKFLILYHTF